MPACGRTGSSAVKEMGKAIKAYDFDQALELFDKTIDY
jgi:hypothetical protein